MLRKVYIVKLIFRSIWSRIMSYVYESQYITSVIDHTEKRMEMYRIRVLNNISQNGLELLPSTLYDVSPNEPEPHGSCLEP